MKHTKLILLAMAALLASCSMVGPIDTSLGVYKPLVKPTREMGQTTLAASVDKNLLQEPAMQGTQFFKVPVTPLGGGVIAQTSAAAPIVPNANDETVSAVTLDGIPLPQFINTIYSTILKRNVSVDPAILTRTDLVSLRTGKPQSAAQLSAAARTVLQSYGVSVNEFDGLVRAVPSGSVGGGTPEILRGRAQPDVPGPLRPIFYLVELENTSQTSVASWIKTLFQGRVTVTEDSTRNALFLSGQSDGVMAAVDAIRVLDRPAMRGRFSARIAPVFWSATDLAGRLTEVLTGQGYSVAQTAISPSPILLIPIAPTNSLLVFAVSEEALNNALRWARELDQTPSSGSGRYITYYVRNTDAADVAKTLQDVLGGGGGAVAAAGAVGATAPATGGRTGGSSRVVVNAAANSIIIQSSPSEYAQIYGLLQELDRPAKSALIMTTVAEVSLSDDEQFGFNWLLSQFNSGGYIVNGGMGPRPAGGATSASGIALNIASLTGDPRALLTALATSSRVRVLSNPSVVAINGQQASIQVGQDVPILTSQISNSNTGTSTGQGVLQTVQYRNVGIILKVKPTIRSGGRIDLDISQEVSGVSTAATGLGNSPVLNTRRVETRLSTSDGNSMLIGGLIQEQRDGANAGIPYLKEIPIVGGLFRSSGSNKITRTELVLLITPHVIEDDFDSNAITEAFKNQFSWGKDVPLSSKSRPEVVSASPQVQKLPLVLQSERYNIPAVVAESSAGGGVLQSNTDRSQRLPKHEAVVPPVETQSQSPLLPSANPLSRNVQKPLGTGGVVTDEKLRAELLDAIRGNKK